MIMTNIAQQSMHKHTTKNKAESTVVARTYSA